MVRMDGAIIGCSTTVSGGMYSPRMNRRILRERRLSRYSSTVFIITVTPQSYYAFLAYIKPPRIQKLHSGQGRSNCRPIAPVKQEPVWARPTSETRGTQGRRGCIS